MYSRWYSVMVVGLWLAAMSWLVIEKVLPRLLIGEPPSYRTIRAAQKRESPVGWSMDFNGRRLGWALSTTSPGPNGVTEIRSRVHFDHLPLEELAPPWLRTLLKMTQRPIAPIKMDVQSTLTVDPLDRLQRFESLVRLDPLKDAIVLRGVLDGTKLTLTVTAGGLPSKKTDFYLPSDVLVGDALSPQTQLPGLRQGQSWTVPVYSPLRPLGSPLEILQATVERKDSITWDGHTEQTWLVVYRRDSGFSFNHGKNARGKLWVRRDGTVLRQEVMILDATMTFVRLADEQADALSASTGMEEAGVAGNGREEIRSTTSSE